MLCRDNFHLPAAANEVNLWTEENEQQKSILFTLRCVKKAKYSTNSKDKSQRKWHLMNAIIVSFPLVFHIINLWECSCISVWALTKSIQTLCCAVIQITQVHANIHTHLCAHTWIAPHLCYQPSSMADNHDQHRAASLFTASVCGEFSLPSTQKIIFCNQSTTYQMAHFFTPSLEVIVTLWNITQSSTLWDTFRLLEVKYRPEISEQAQRNHSGVFMERAWSTLETKCLLWIWWGG